MFVLMMISDSTSPCPSVSCVEQSSSFALVTLWLDGVDQLTGVAPAPDQPGTASQTSLHAHSATAPAPYQSISGTQTLKTVVLFTYKYVVV